jgi:hypothetical protein|nr:MAG TPA: hypothetical protein [Caudoviricetes sp.]
MKFKTQKGKTLYIDCENIIEIAGWADTNKCVVDYYAQVADYFEPENKLIVAKSIVVVGKFEKIVKEVKKELAGRQAVRIAIHGENRFDLNEWLKKGLKLSRYQKKSSQNERI